MQIRDITPKGKHTKKTEKWYESKNKLASLEATLVRNYDSLTDRGKV